MMMKTVEVKKSVWDTRIIMIDRQETRSDLNFQGLWSFSPTDVIRILSVCALKKYANRHQYGQIQPPSFNEREIHGSCWMMSSLRAPLFRDNRATVRKGAWSEPNRCCSDYRPKGSISQSIWNHLGTDSAIQPKPIGWRDSQSGCWASLSDETSHPKPSGRLAKCEDVEHHR